MTLKDFVNHFIALAMVFKWYALSAVVVLWAAFSILLCILGGRVYLGKNVTEVKEKCICEGLSLEHPKLSKAKLPTRKSSLALFCKTNSSTSYSQMSNFYGCVSFLQHGHRLHTLSRLVTVKMEESEWLVNLLLLSRSEWGAPPPAVHWGSVACLYDKASMLSY